MVLSSLFFKEIGKNGSRDHGRYIRECKRKATKVGMAATMSRKSVFFISHITLPDCRVHFSPTTFLETGVYNKGV